MLFGSYSFLFIFLPIALAGYFFAARAGATYAVSWLVLASLAFYAVWNPTFVLLLLCSIGFNFAVGRALLSRESDEQEKSRNRLFVLGISGNLLPLFYFKYFGPIVFFAHAHALIAKDLDFKIILPLGISFFTFTQIGYLVDCYDGEGKDLDIIRYAAFVAFFPHLIAGPILHVREIGPQLLDADRRLRLNNLTIGTSLFVMGLAKKVLLADPLADTIGIGFTHPADFKMFFSWLYALAYSFQLYFDFSGYSDMAIGLAYMFGIKFPINFNSPYKSINIIDFWQRFHITLTRYLTLLLYNPLALRIARRRPRTGRGSNTRSLVAFTSLIAVPMFVTMGLAGLWHGAGMQFLIFGLMHGAYLTINHAWHMFGPKLQRAPGRLFGAMVVASKVFLTYVAIVVAEVMFRSSSVGAALEMLGGMIGLHGVDPIPVPSTVMTVLRHLGPLHVFLTQTHHILAVPIEDSIPPPARLALLFFIVWALPNTQQIMAKFLPTSQPIRERVPRWLSWQPSASWALGIGILLAVSLMSLQQTKVFLYFQF